VNKDYHNFQTHRCRHFTAVIHWPVNTTFAQYVPCVSIEWHYASAMTIRKTAVKQTNWS